MSTNFFQLAMINLKINVSTLLKAQLGKSITLSVDTGPQKLGDLAVEFLRGTVQVTRIQKGLFVSGTVKSQLNLDCVRCLESFTFPLSLELEETFRLPGAEPDLDQPYTVDDDGKLDLAPLLRELAWVSIPMKPLCDPACEGLCPHCGVNLNHKSCTCEEEQIDPRLAVLKDWL
jgi:uncharacterized protein